MADPLRCPVCDATAPAEPAPSGEPVVCRGCGWPFDLPLSDDPLPLAEEIPAAVPVRPSAPLPPRRALPPGEVVVARWFRRAVVAAGILLVGSCGLGVWATGPHWREHTSERGGFRAEFPAAPRTDFERLLKAPPSSDQHAEGTVLPFRRQEYGVIYANLSPDVRAVGAKALLAEAVGNVFGQEAGAKLLENESVTVSGFPGREAVVALPDGRVAVFRLVAAGPRFYIAYASGRAGARDHPDFRRFLDSFAVTDPDLLARVPRR